MITVKVNDRYHLEIDALNVTLCVDYMSAKGNIRTERFYYNNVADALVALQKMDMSKFDDKVIESIPEYIECLKSAHRAFKEEIVDSLGGKLRSWEFFDNES